MLHNTKSVKNKNKYNTFYYYFLYLSFSFLHNAKIYMIFLHDWSLVSMSPISINEKVF